MEARIISLALLPLIYLSLGANYASKNFVVSAPDAATAKQVAELAEKYRSELAIHWLGKELPDWEQKCPILVEIEPHAGGETSFAFVRDASGRSRPVDWRMQVQGPYERILDSVLPHEITHTVFATHYGRPLPRWADEGACTTVEHPIEKKKNHKMLLEFLTSNRGIPFNHMFAMKQYPRDILPLYAQGYSLARFLIMKKGPKHFVNYVGEGMEREIPGREPQTWNEVTKKYYGFDNLSDLQLSWLQWVKNGSREIVAKEPATATPEAIVATPAAFVGTLESSGGSSSEIVEGSWYVRQMQRPSGTTSAAVRATVNGTPAKEYRPGSTSANPTMDARLRTNTMWR